MAFLGDGSFLGSVQDNCIITDQIDKELSAGAKAIGSTCQMMTASKAPKDVVEDVIAEDMLSHAQRNKVLLPRWREAMNHPNIEERWNALRAEVPSMRDFQKEWRNATIDANAITTARLLNVPFITLDKSAHKVCRKRHTSCILASEPLSKLNTLL